MTTPQIELDIAPEQYDFHPPQPIATPQLEAAYDFMGATETEPEGGAPDELETQIRTLVVQCLALREREQMSAMRREQDHARARACEQMRVYLNAWRDNHAKVNIARQSTEQGKVFAITQRISVALSLLQADMHGFQQRARELENFRAMEVNPSLRAAAEALQALENTVRDEDESFRIHLTHSTDAFIRSSKRLREGAAATGSFEVRQKKFLADLHA